MAGDELTGPGAGTDWVWRPDRIGELLTGTAADLLFVSGTLILRQLGCPSRTS